MFQKLIVSFCFVIYQISASSCYFSSSRFNASSFFDDFNFETIDDPTHGYVDYIGKEEAFDSGLVGYFNNQVYIGVDHKDVVPDYSRGRKSIRLSSKRVLTGNNLVVIDLAHMPTTLGNRLKQGCSIWPAFWTFGPNWPNSGEIDIIEYVNTDSSILTTLHTSSKCDQSGEDTSAFSGSWSTATPDGQPSDNCDVSAAGQYSNAGCGIVGEGNTVGAAFNARGTGGIFVMEWTVDQHIRVFFFPKDRAPDDLLRKQPNPDSWGKPYAAFEIGPNSDCSSDHFANHNIIFDLTFCGDWAGSGFSYSCSAAQSCESFVKYNPDEFTEAFWLINGVDVYDQC